MLEMLINPKRAERKPWEMGIIGFVYALLSVVLAKFLFAGDPVLSQYLPIFIITFCVIFSIPFVYFTIRIEEEKDESITEETTLLKEHSKAIISLLWLFIGYILAFTIAYSSFSNGELFFKAQIETYCQMNRPDTYSECLSQYGLQNNKLTGNSISDPRIKMLAIFSNNIYVLIFTLMLSLLMGAGAIFILAWNASVIAAAIGIFTNSDISKLHLGLLRYMLHGIPEIAAYFIGALAGGILSMLIIRRNMEPEKKWSIIGDSAYLVIIALIILFLSALIEVFITPSLFLK
jgi:uncharacterized membrane protein SpoIIM required for sporulation